MKTIKYILGVLFSLFLMGCAQDDYVASFTDLKLVRMVPSSGYEGDIVTILGRNFSTVLEENIVEVNGKKAKVLEFAKDELSIIMPKNEPGTYTIKVTTPEQSIEGLAYRYNVKPEKEYFVSTVAGRSGVIGFVDGVGANARFYNVEGLNYDKNGNIWIMQRYGGGNSAVRVMSPNYNITTLTNDTKLNYPWQGEFDENNDLYVANKGGNNLLKVTMEGVVSVVPTPGVTLGNPMGVSFDSENVMYVTNRNNNSVYAFKNGALLDTYKIDVTMLEPIEVDGHDNIFIGSSKNPGLYQYDKSTGETVLVAGTGSKPTIATYTDGEKGNPLSATVGLVSSIFYAKDGSLYFSDRSSVTIRQLSPDASGDYTKGTVTTIAGTGCESGTADGEATRAQFTYPEGIIVSNDCTEIYVCDPLKFVVRRIKLK